MECHHEDQRGGEPALRGTTEEVRSFVPGERRLVGTSQHYP